MFTRPVLMLFMWSVLHCLYNDGRVKEVGRFVFFAPFVASCENYADEEGRF